MADYFKKYKSLYSSTSNSFGTGEGVTITPNSVSGLPTDTEIVLTFDRVDSGGTATPSNMERIRGTISGGNLSISSSGRGYDGSTEQAHTSPVVEQIWNAADWNDLITGLLVQHTQTGLHKAITTSDITASLVTASQVTASNMTTRLTHTACTVIASQVTSSNITARLTATACTVTASGINASWITASQITGWGARFPAFYGEFDNGNSGSAIAIDWLNGDRQKLTVTASTTLTYSNAQKGMTLGLDINEASGGGFSVSMPASTIWPGGTVGTFTTSANAKNSIVCRFNGSQYLTQLAANFA